MSSAKLGLEPLYSNQTNQTGNKVTDADIQMKLLVAIERLEARVEDLEKRNPEPSSSDVIHVKKIKSKQTTALQWESWKSSNLDEDLEGEDLSPPSALAKFGKHFASYESMLKGIPGVGSPEKFIPGEVTATIFFGPSNKTGVFQPCRRKKINK